MRIFAGVLWKGGVKRQWDHMLTLVVCFCFYAHLLRLGGGGKKSFIRVYLENVKFVSFQLRAWWVHRPKTNFEDDRHQRKQRYGHQSRKYLYLRKYYTGIVKIPTANLRLSTAASSKRVPLSYSNDDQKWPPKPEILTCISLERWQIAVTDSVEIPTDFGPWRARWKCCQLIAITSNNPRRQDWRPDRLYCYFRLPLIVTIVRGQILRAQRGRKP